MPLQENLLIARIRERARGGGGVVAGIGDDAAVLRIPSAHQALVTTDFSLEGIHFRREWHRAEVVGRRALTRGLSDIAAMGGQPIAAFLSLALPPTLPQAWVNGFFEGLLSLAETFKVSLAGGDTSESPGGVLIDIVVVGSVPRDQAISRSGARAGDRIYVTGKLGGASAALNLLFSGCKLRAHDFPQHFHPMPRIQVGRFLRERAIASAMIDLSDGLSSDLAHICAESRVGAEIEAEAIPLARLGKPATPVDRRFALHGGEDYELLFTAPPGVSVPSRIAGSPITAIGRIRPDRRMLLIGQGRRVKLAPRGWQHFAPRRSTSRVR
ncbi:MAG TPA: thiamine-phosphate kinase [Terriglobales bacterium]|nr:thiamine-phosphate kinase [Terriglobales bacterium]